MNARSACTCASMSCSERSGRPSARRRSFCASSICCTSSSSSSASTSGERVGFQSSTSAPETGWYLPIAAKIRNRISRKPRKKAPSTSRDSTYHWPVPEEQITEADIERMQRGMELYNSGAFDALREFFSDDLIVERAGEMPPLHGWDAFRQLLEPDAFEWQRLHPLDWTINGDRALLHVRMHAKGAGSGLELELDGWQVWTVEEGLVKRIQAFLDEPAARAAAG